MKGFLFCAAVAALSGSLLGADISYFPNVQVATNLTAGGSVSAAAGAFTNSLMLNGNSVLTNAPSSNWSASGTTNSTLPGNAYLNALTATNGVTAGASTFSGQVTSTSSTTNGPSATEFATAGWVRNLLTGGTTILYNSGDTNSSGSFDTPVYSYIATAPAYGSRTYLQATLTNGVYFGSVMTTNKYLQLGGDVTVQPYISSAGGNASSYYTVHAEIYYSYDGSTLLGDWDSGVQSLVHGVTNGYSFTVPVPTTVSTNSTGFYIVRRMRIDQKFGTGDDIKMHYGTNYASKILLPTPTSVGANWVASGSTNSYLVGQAIVNAIISTNGVYIPPASLTHAGTITLNLSAYRTEADLNSITGNVTFATSNLAAGHSYTVFGLNTQATNCTPTFPAWTFMGGIPATITAGKYFVLSLSSRGSADTNVFASYAESQ